MRPVPTPRPPPPVGASGAPHLHMARCPEVQCEIRSRPGSVPIRLSRRSALQNLQIRFRRSELELHGPRSGLK
eukprot:3626216-Alexandrium_andersonii.AAC.1